MAEDQSLNVKREYAQLIALHARLHDQLERIRDELVSPGTMALLQDIRSRAGTAPDLAEIVTAVEEAVRAFQLSDATLRDGVEAEVGSFHIDGISNLPSHIQRFLAERASTPGFKYDVVDDDIRGWIIRWKEYTHRGTIRGFGQFCERPHAWLDD